MSHVGSVGAVKVTSSPSSSESGNVVDEGFRLPQPGRTGELVNSGAVVVSLTLNALWLSLPAA